MLVLVVVMAGCASPGLHASAPAGSPPGRSPASFPSPAAAASTSLGASTTLAAFFAAAKQVDGRLRQAATLVNGGIGSDQIRRSQATIDALHALNPGEAAAVPAGLPTGLLRHVLVVQSDLASRTDAVDGILELWRPGLFPATDRPALFALRCLGQGAASAAQLSADLGAAETAAASPPVAVAPPESRSGEELAVRLESIRLRNNGWGQCGGVRVTQLEAVAWHEEPPAFPGDRPWEGHIAGIAFRGPIPPQGGGRSSSGPADERPEHPALQRVFAVLPGGDEDD
ncbi:MAG TPA: hypothetical protein VET24_16460 [Actinomycetota bacterium]|nr:hypothetical protein [Actinomycetota bacterium]